VSYPGAADVLAVKFTGKLRDNETGLDFFGARYFSGAMGRFTSVDRVMLAKQKLADPQQWNMYSYGPNNPLRFVDPTGNLIELVGSDEQRKKLLDALKQGVGDKAASYLKERKSNGFLGLGKTHYYVETTDSKAFAGTNAVANKLGGLINDTSRTAQVEFASPQGRLGAGPDKSPALTAVLPNLSNTQITSGPLGNMPANISSTGQQSPMNLSEVLIHELGHVDAGWYHGGLVLDGIDFIKHTNGDAVRIEDQVREIMGDPVMRTGHDKPGDVPLEGETY
jgi:RHS repeat-associated protein